MHFRHCTPTRLPAADPHRQRPVTPTHQPRHFHSEAHQLVQRRCASVSVPCSRALVGGQRVGTHTCACLCGAGVSALAAVMLYRVATEITGKSGIACWTAGAAAVRYAKRGVTFCHHVVSYCAAMCVCVRVCVCSGARVDCIRLLAPHLAVCHRQRGVCSQPVLRRVAVVPCYEVPPHTPIPPHLWQ